MLRCGRAAADLLQSVAASDSAPSEESDVIAQMIMNVREDETEVRHEERHNLPPRLYRSKGASEVKEISATQADYDCSFEVKTLIIAPGPVLYQQHRKPVFIEAAFRHLCRSLHDICNGLDRHLGRWHREGAPRPRYLASSHAARST